jgi:hypothetical protein
MPISTRDLSGLPDLRTLEKTARSLAMLDAILSPEWVYRYFHFNPNWDPATGDRMAIHAQRLRRRVLSSFYSRRRNSKGFRSRVPNEPVDLYSESSLARSSGSCAEGVRSLPCRARVQLRGHHILHLETCLRFRLALWTDCVS